MDLIRPVWALDRYGHAIRMLIDADEARVPADRGIGIAAEVRKHDLREAVLPERQRLGMKDQAAQHVVTVQDRLTGSEDPKGAIMVEETGRDHIVEQAV